MAEIDWDRPIVYEDGVKARLAGTLSASGSFLTPERKQQYAEEYAEYYEMGVRHLVWRGDESFYRAYNEHGFELDIYLDELFGQSPKGKFRIVQKELDMAGMDENVLWGQF